jgi:hypothetical protein
MRNCIACFVFLFFSFYLGAQDFLPDSVIYRLALNQTLAYNNSATTKTSGLYIGSLYVRDYYNVKGHPFFQTDSFRKGDVFYNGVLYKNVNLLYDLSHDNLITEYQEETKLVLVPEKIGRFILSGHLFVRHNDPSPAGEGFYDLLFEGKIAILVKRIRMLATSIRSPEFNAEFVQQDNYFLYKDSIYYSVNSKKELLNVLKDKKKELKDFISKNRPEFKKDFESALLQTARYYDQISK